MEHTLYPPARPSTDFKDFLGIGEEECETHFIQVVLTVEKALSFKNEIEDDVISTFLSYSASFSQPKFQFLDDVIQPFGQEQ